MSRRRSRATMAGTVCMPSRRAARSRRSPAISVKSSSPAGRTISGWRHAELANRVRQRRDRLLVKVRTRLIRVSRRCARRERHAIRLRRNPGARLAGSARRAPYPTRRVAPRLTSFASSRYAMAPRDCRVKHQNRLPRTRGASEIRTPPRGSQFGTPSVRSASGLRSPLARRASFARRTS